MGCKTLNGQIVCVAFDAIIQLQLGALLQALNNNVIQYRSGEGTVIGLGLSIYVCLYVYKCCV